MTEPTITRIVTLDTETGGLRPTDEPWEIAMVVDDIDGGHERHLFHVLDFEPAQADPIALRLGGYYDRHPYASKDDIIRACIQSCTPGHGLRHVLSGGQAASTCVTSHGLSGEDLVHPVNHLIEHADCLATTIEPIVRDAFIYACNYGYDVSRLERMLNKAGHAWTANYRPVDADKYAAGVAGLHPFTKNSDIGAALGVSRDQHGTEHGALPDALYARSLIVAALARNGHGLFPTMEQVPA